MRKPQIAVAILLTVGITAMFASPAGATAPQVSPDTPSIVGDWRGDSICVVRESACHDEDSLYHVTKLESKPGWFSMKLDKIVEGKPVTMGTMDCSYDHAKRALTCEFPKGVMQFSVIGDNMQGTMTLRDGTLWRKLNLRKS
jgi:hypothetical protein